MSSISILLYCLLFVLNLLIFVRTKKEVSKQNAFGLTQHLTILGIFVWGDALLIAPFWTLVSVISWVIGNIYFFGLVVAIFWIVRAQGEVMYWMHEQFAVTHRNPPESLAGYSVVKNESIWFLYQLGWQLISVVAIIASLYFGKKWLIG